MLLRAQGADRFCVVLDSETLFLYLIVEVRGANTPLWPAPCNREIGFVSSSFSFRVGCASGRGEASWA